MDRDERIAMEREIQLSTTMAENILHEAVKCMADGGVGPGCAVISMLLMGFRHLDQMPADMQCDAIRVVVDLVNEACDALEADGCDVSEFGYLRTAPVRGNAA